MPNLFFFAPVPLLVVATTGTILRTLRRATHGAPFVLTLIPLTLGYSGLLISI